MTATQSVPSVMMMNLPLPSHQKNPLVVQAVQWFHEELVLIHHTLFHWIPSSSILKNLMRHKLWIDMTYKNQLCLILKMRLQNKTYWMDWSRKNWSTHLSACRVTCLVCYKTHYKVQHVCGLVRILINRLLYRVLNLIIIR